MEINKNVVVESEFAREGLMSEVDGFDLLNKIGNIDYVEFQGKEVVTIHQLSRYYAVPYRTIEKATEPSNNRHEELKKEGMFKVDGDDLRNFKDRLDNFTSRADLAMSESNNINKDFTDLDNVLESLQNEETLDLQELYQEKLLRVRSLTLFPKSAAIRFGFLLRDSQRAELVRDFAMSLIRHTDEDTKENIIEEKLGQDYPETYPDALRALADIEEEKQKVETQTPPSTGFWRKQMNKKLKSQLAKEVNKVFDMDELDVSQHQIIYGNFDNILEKEMGTNLTKERLDLIDEYDNKADKTIINNIKNFPIRAIALKKTLRNRFTDMVEDIINGDKELEGFAYTEMKL